MNVRFKRITAYVIDMLIVSVVVFGLTNIKQINYQYDNHEKVSSEYEKYVKKYEKLEDKYNDAKDDYKDKKITKEKYSKIKNEYKDYKSGYERNIKKFNYDLSRNSVIATIISIAVIIAYFGIFQYSMGGQTIGKKILKLKVVNNKEGSLNILNYLIRCAILNGVIINILLIVFVNIFNANSFYTANYVVSNIQSIVEILILIMIFMTSDARGLHDYIAGTKVVEIDSTECDIINDSEEVEYIPKDKKNK